MGALMIVAGALLSSWCAAIFLFVGKGSPHPFAMKTKRLVTTGPYGLVRNPMMWGIGTLLIGLALALGSVGLWFGLACFVLFVRWFVPYYEEPDMERRFGEEYREYCRRTPRWWPVLIRPSSATRK
jgi:protein-S-isoprenylcysteine O-methyltransferase Ste14